MLLKLLVIYILIFQTVTVIRSQIDLSLNQENAKDETEYSSNKIKDLYLDKPNIDSKESNFNELKSDEEILANLKIFENEIETGKHELIFDQYSAKTRKHSKILMVPTVVNSHSLYFGQVGLQLAKLGHKVEILIASCIPDILQKIKHKNLIFTRYQVERNASIMSSDDVSSILLDIALSKSMWYQYLTILKLEYYVKPAFEEDCRSVIYNQKLMSYIEKEKFDFVITDPIVTAIHCYNILPIKLNIPYAFLSLPFLAEVFGVPRLPSFNPFIGMAATNRMNFYERISSFIQKIIFVNLFDIPCVDCVNLLPANTQHPSGTREALKRASAWFFLEHFSITYPSANQPNTLSVGSILSTALKSNPISQELEDFVSHSNEGTILVSFGSYFDNIPDKLGDKFCEAFINRPKNKIIWKMKYTPPNCKFLDNVKIVSWFPQVDLLAHQKTILFITHGGLNSLIEALHFQIPMIVIPIAMDQKNNAVAVQDKGYAISMELASDDLEIQLHDNIEKILRDESFAMNIRKFSNILRYKGASVDVAVSMLIDHIVEHGDDHLRSSSIGMSSIQLYMFDIFLFLFAIIVLVLIILAMFLVIICKKKLISTKIKTS